MNRNAGSTQAYIIFWGNHFGQGMSSNKGWRSEESTKRENLCLIQNVFKKQFMKTTFEKPNTWVHALKQLESMYSNFFRVIKRVWVQTEVEDRKRAPSERTYACRIMFLKNSFENKYHLIGRGYQTREPTPQRTGLFQKCSCRQRAFQR